ncbi:MAG TPA: aldehyde dehydrogenase family protein, partial [Azonexus sp.]|nr:aldehyde dehydrogenase family protein [Azonexus sp.]
MRKVELLIGGESRPAANGASFERRNPVSGEVATLAAAATLADADAAVAAAAAAFPAWAALAPSARRALLLKAAEIMDRRAPEFVATGVDEAA